jgi:hypothetical protein
VIDCNTPDEDFAFMSCAPIFIKGKGGYSDIIQRIVKNTGGQIFRHLSGKICINWILN